MKKWILLLFLAVCPLFAQEAPHIRTFSSTNYTLAGASTNSLNAIVVLPDYMETINLVSYFGTAGAASTSPGGFTFTFQPGFLSMISTNSQKTTNWVSNKNMVLTFTGDGTAAQVMGTNYNVSGYDRLRLTTAVNTNLVAAGTASNVFIYVTGHPAAN